MKAPTALNHNTLVFRIEGVNDVMSRLLCMIQRLLCLQVRERLEDDPVFTAVTVEAERIRLFNDHISALEVGVLSFCFVFFLIRMQVIPDSVQDGGYKMADLLNVWRHRVVDKWRCQCFHSSTTRLHLPVTLFHRKLHYMGGYSFTLFIRTSQ